jgi:uncharacterized membrane protein
MNFLRRPDYLFLVFSTFFGLILCFELPPLGGGNEMYNFQRAASIAYGHPLVEEAEVPSGISEFITAGFTFFHEGLSQPFSYSRDEYRKVAAIPLRASEPVALSPNAIAVHHPFSYIPQALVLRLGAVFNASPLMLFYLARLGGLLSAIALTFLAIRLAPSRQYAFCALALLPSITFARSCFDADPVTNGLAFLFIACMLREIARSGPVSMRSLALLALLAFVVGQCKSAYFVLLLLALAIPQARFVSRFSWLTWMGILILPGIVASVGWMLLVKQSYFTGVSYHTYSGEVDPDRQLAFILGHPFAYLATFLRTLFMTPFFPQALLGILGGFGPGLFIPMPVLVVVVGLLFGVIVADRTGAGATYPGVGSLTAVIFLAFIGLSLTILYIQWTGFGLPVIEGFSGRYFFPLLPLLLLFAKPPEKPMPMAPGVGVTALACAGLPFMLWSTLQAYYG